MQQAGTARSGRKRQTFPTPSSTSPAPSTQRTEWTACWRWEALERQDGFRRVPCHLHFAAKKQPENVHNIQTCRLLFFWVRSRSFFALISAFHLLKLALFFCEKESMLPRALFSTKKTGPLFCSFDLLFLALLF